MGAVGVHHLPEPLRHPGPRHRRRHGRQDPGRPRQPAQPRQDVRQGRLRDGGPARSRSHHHAAAQDEPGQGRRCRPCVGADQLGRRAVGDRGTPEDHPGRGPQRAPVLHLRRLPVAGAVHRCLDQRVRPSRLHDVVGADLLRQQRARHQLHEPERLRGRPGPGVLEVHHAVRLAVRLGRALRHDARRPRAVRASPRRPEDRLDRPGAGSRRLQGRGVGADPARHRRRLDPGHGQPTGQRAAHLRRVVRQAAHERAVPRGAGRSLCPRARHRQAAGVGRQRRHGQALRRRRGRLRPDRYLHRRRGRGEAGIPASQGSRPPIHPRARRGDHVRAGGHRGPPGPRLWRSVRDRGHDRHRRPLAALPAGVGRVVPGALRAQARHADRAGHRAAARADRRAGRPRRPAGRPLRAAGQEPVARTAVPGQLRGLDPAELHRRRAGGRHVPAAARDTARHAGVLRAAARRTVRGHLLPAGVGGARRLETPHLAAACSSSTTPTSSRPPGRPT